MTQGVDIRDHVYDTVPNPDECHLGNGSIGVPLDMPVCVSEGTELMVTFEDTGRVSLKVRSELGIQNDCVQPLLDSARGQVAGLLPEDVQISLFRAPSEQVYFGHPEREFCAQITAR